MQTSKKEPPPNSFSSCEDEDGVDREAKNTQAHYRKANIFSCSHCLFESFQESDLQEHLSVHADVTPLKGLYSEHMASANPCGSEDSPSDTHTACEEGNGAEENIEVKEALVYNGHSCIFSCSHCPFESFQESDLHEHLITHADITPLKCPYCEFTASTQAYLSEGSPSNKDVPNCSANVSNGAQSNVSGDKDIYEIIDSPEGKKLYKCIYCKYTTCKETSINTHAHVHSGLNPVKCIYCGFATARPKDIKRHMLSHTGERPYPCPLCPYKAAQLAHIQEHMHTHTGMKRHKCPHCNYRTAKKTNLNAHLPVHTGERPFPCPTCPFKAARKKDLNRHVLIHTGERPYKCPHCPYRANQSSHLQDHLLTHFGEKRYTCSYCDYRTSRAYNLKSHTRIHTGETPYECSFCDYKAKHQGGLRQHLRSHTSDMLNILSHRPH